MNVSNIKSNGLDDKTPATFENDRHIQTTSASPVNSVYSNKKSIGHYGDPMKHGRDKQLLHQVSFLSTVTEAIK